MIRYVREYQVTASWRQRGQLPARKEWPVTRDETIVDHQVLEALIQRPVPWVVVMGRSVREEKKWWERRWVKTGVTDWEPHGFDSLDVNR